MGLVSHCCCRSAPSELRTRRFVSGSAKLSYRAWPGFAVSSRRALPLPEGRQRKTKNSASQRISFSPLQARDPADSTHVHVRSTYVGR